MYRDWSGGRIYLDGPSLHGDKQAEFRAWGNIYVSWDAVEFPLEILRLAVEQMQIVSPFLISVLSVMLWNGARRQIYKLGC